MRVGLYRARDSRIGWLRVRGSGGRVGFSNWTGAANSAQARPERLGRLVPGAPRAARPVLPRCAPRSRSWLKHTLFLNAMNQFLGGMFRQTMGKCFTSAALMARTGGPKCCYRCAHKASQKECQTIFFGHTQGGSKKCARKLL